MSMIIEPEYNGKNATPVLSWKRLIVRTLAWGVGCGLGISLVLLSMVLYMQRPKAWNTYAFRVKGTKAEGLYRVGKRSDLAIGERLELTMGGIFFTVDLENTTATDITLRETVRVMETTKATGTLHGSPLKLYQAYFIPAHHTVSITLENNDLCAPKAEPHNCFDSNFKDESEIVLFDEPNKYEIHVPIPGFSAGTSAGLLLGRRPRL